MQIVGELEVLLEDEERDEALAACVAELVDVVVGVVDDGLCFVGVVDVVVEAFLEVGKVGTHANVVVVGLEAAFHEPGLAGGLRHDGDGV